MLGELGAGESTILFGPWDPGIPSPFTCIKRACLGHPRSGSKGFKRLVRDTICFSLEKKRSQGFNDVLIASPFSDRKVPILDVRLIYVCFTTELTVWYITLTYYQQKIYQKT